MQDELKPIYAVGDRVLLSNPIDIFEVEDTKVYEITHVKFIPNYMTYAYRLDNGTKWVNEAWLEPDLFGPQYLDEEVDGMKRNQPKKLDERKALLADMDYELASLHDAIQTQNETEIQRSKARLSEIQHELETVK